MTWLIAPGKAHARHGFVESFDGRFRGELLDETPFSSLTEARRQIQAWQEDCSHHRPHSGLGNIPPAEVAAKNDPAIRAA